MDTTIERAAASISELPDEATTDARVTRPAEPIAKLTTTSPLAPVRVTEPKAFFRALSRAWTTERYCAPASLPPDFFAGEFPSRVAILLSRAPATF